jgi:hypothetical protein
MVVFLTALMLVGAGGCKPRVDEAADVQSLTEPKTKPTELAGKDTRLRWIDEHNQLAFEGRCIEGLLIHVRNCGDIQRAVPLKEFIPALDAALAQSQAALAAINQEHLAIVAHDRERLQQEAARRAAPDATLAERYQRFLLLVGMNCRLNRDCLGSDDLVKLRALVKEEILEGLMDTQGRPAFIPFEFASPELNRRSDEYVREAVRAAFERFPTSGR